MPNYRRNRVLGATFFFTVNLADRRTDLLVRDIDGLHRKEQNTVTRPSKKSLERHFVEEAAKRLGKSWFILVDREHPDFVVTDGDQMFGLEICEIFTGQRSQRGSADKQGEAVRQRAIHAVQGKYEAIENIPLIVKFVGDMVLEDLEKVVPALVAENLAAEPICHHVIIDIDTGFRPRLRVHVTKALWANWFSVNDRVGWVDRYPLPSIIDIVNKKSRKLSQYIEGAGSDIRLLIVANRIHNSGRMTFEEQVSLEKKGFQTIYFFSYPETATEIIGAAQR